MLDLPRVSSAYTFARPPSPGASFVTDAALMLPIVLSIAASLCWGLASIFVRWGQRDLPTAAGTLMSLASGTLVTAIVALALASGSLFDVSLTTLLAFAAVGVLNFPLGRYLSYLSIDYLGIGRSSPVLASAPLFAMVLAVALAGESLNAGIVAGTLLVLAGVVVTLKARDAD